MTEGEFDIKKLLLDDLGLKQKSTLLPFTEEIESYFKLSAVQLPDTLYHYITSSIANSIYQNQELRLYSVFDPANEENKGAGTPDQKEVIAGLEIICDEITALFNREKMKCFHIFSQKFHRLIKSRYQDFAKIHIFCVAAGPNVHLWKKAAEGGSPACLEIKKELFDVLCAGKEKRDNGYSVGQYFPLTVCYNPEELRERIRPYCTSAVKTLWRAVKDSNGDRQFLWLIMRELSQQLSLPVLTEAYGYKSPQFSVENEIRLVKIFPYNLQPEGLQENAGRSYIIEKIDPSFPIRMFEDHNNY